MRMRKAWLDDLSNNPLADVLMTGLRTQLDGPGPPLQMLIGPIQVPLSSLASYCSHLYVLFLREFTT